jgi:hypothetical protein
MRRNGAGVVTTANAGAALCDLIGPASAKAVDPTISVVVIFAFRGGAVDQRPCLGGDGSVARFVADTRAIIDPQVDAGKKVLIVPPPVDGGGTGEDPVAPAYRQLAQQYPGTVEVGDVGQFIRSGSTWTRFADCLPGEAGCAADGRVQVRRGPPDKWRHFCTSPGFSFDATACPPQYAAGERRGASSIGAKLVEMIP